MENCSYYNNTGKDQSHFEFNNNSVVIQNSYFHNNYVYNSLIRTESSHISLQGTTFDVQKGFLYGLNSRINVFDCSINCDFLGSLIDSNLDIWNSTLICSDYDTYIEMGVTRSKPSVSVINSVLHTSTISLYRCDLNIEGSHFAKSGVILSQGNTYT